MTNYKCDNCNIVFDNHSKKPRCPKCNRLSYIRHKPLKPYIKIEYKKETLSSDDE